MGVPVLTESIVRNAPMRERPYKLFDERGLFLLVTATGARLWRFRYRIGALEKLISLGAYPDVTLKRAREKRDEARRPVAAITAQELLVTLRRIEARGNHETAHRVRALAGRVLRYAVATGRAQHDVAADLKDALAPVRSRNFASITDPARVGELLRAIGHPLTGLALKLAPLVFVRPGELRGAEWIEFDLKNAEWRIPAARMKMRQPHIVPLSRQALAIITEPRPLARGGRYVFPSLRTRDRPMSDNTINAALRRLGYTSEEQTAHGFRSMASTLLNEHGFPPDIIELQLAHSERNKVRAAYKKAQRLPERRLMMQAWADHLDQLRAGTPLDRVAELESAQRAARGGASQSPFLGTYYRST